MTVSEQKLRRIVQLHAEGLSQSKIAHKLKLSPTTVRKKLHILGLQCDTGRRLVTGRKRKSAPKPEAKKPADLGGLVQRLANAIDATLADLEAPSAKRGTYDKKSRAIASMVRSLEKVLEIKVAEAKTNDTTGGANAEKVRIDAEQLRRDIAERLEKLQQKWDAQQLPR